MVIKPLVLWGHVSGPNPWKVAIILEELELPYEHKMLDFSELKKEPYESLNPNGRVPALQDPNNGITLFESGAIIDYLVDTYDKSHKLSPGNDDQQRYILRSWRDFQMSGQGPYFGQVVWFTKYHPEDVESARARYRAEVMRVIGVIDRHLTKHDYAYLSGPEVSYADLMFAPWNNYLYKLPLLPEGTDLAAQFPAFDGWRERIATRPAVAKVFEDQKRAVQEGH